MSSNEYEFKGRVRRDFTCYDVCGELAVYGKQLGNMTPFWYAHLVEKRPDLVNHPDLHDIAEIPSVSSRSHSAMASAVSSLAGSGNERFNAEAANWDKNPLVHEASKEACTALLQRYPDLQIQAPGKGLDVLEIGCGTGILSFNMAPFVRHIVAIDAAEGMIEVLKGKTKQADAPKNITPIAVLLEDPEDSHLPQGKDGSRMKFDLVLSHLVLHHIPDLKAVLTTMLGCLNPGGSVALPDFEDFGPEARRFHPHAKMAGVERHGINREKP